MSVYPKPTAQQGAIFNPDLWIVSDVNGVSVDYLNENYLQFPVAQGFETLNGMTNLQSTTIGKNLIMSGEYLTNYIQFPDGTQQFSASGSGTGDALLTGGTSSTPQTFTGYNNFSNVDGQITLTNTTETPISFVTISCDQFDYQVNIGGNLSIGNTANSNTVVLSSSADYTKQLDIAGYLNIQNASNANSVIIASDATNSKQLDVQGALSIGNSTNTNTVVLNSDTSTTNNQLDIQGTLQVIGAGWPIQLAGYGNNTSGVYGLQVSGGGLRLGSNGGTPGSSTYVQLACLDAADNQLYVAGSIQLSNSTLSGNNVTISSGAIGLVISSGIQVGGNCNLVNTVSSIQSTSTLSQSTTVPETVQFNGNLQLFGGTTNRTISLNYSGQDNIEIYQNYTGNLECNSGITISPNIEVYPSNTNRITLYADETTDNQLNVQGNLLTTGNITLGSGSTTSAFLKFGDGSIQTIAYTGGAPILATYTSSTLDTLIVPYVWSFTGISNSLGNQVSWILYSNSAMATSGASTVFSDTNSVIVPSGLSNYIYGYGTAIKIPYKFNDGTTTTTQNTYYPSTIVALGGFTLNAEGNTNGSTDFKVALNSDTNTNFTNGSTLKLVFYAG